MDWDDAIVESLATIDMGGWKSVDPAPTLETEPPKGVDGNSTSCQVSLCGTELKGFSLSCDSKAANLARLRFPDLCQAVLCESKYEGAYCIYAEQGC
jgi:hypothetical protein